MYHAAIFRGAAQMTPGILAQHDGMAMLQAAFFAALHGDTSASDCSRKSQLCSASQDIDLQTNSFSVYPLELHVQPSLTRPSKTLRNSHVEGNTRVCCLRSSYSSLDSTGLLLRLF